MEGKNKFNTYIVSFDYPSSYSSVFLRLRSLMYVDLPLYFQTSVIT